MTKTIGEMSRRLVKRLTAERRKAKRSAQFRMPTRRYRHPPAGGNR